jgi:hypothetical protein
MMLMLIMIMMQAFNDAYDHEQLTFTWGTLVAPPAEPDELAGGWSCCARAFFILLV